MLHYVTVPASSLKHLDRIWVKDIYAEVDGNPNTTLLESVDLIRVYVYTDKLSFVHVDEEGRQYIDLRKMEPVLLLGNV